MVQKDSRSKILQPFFDFPRRDFHMRELSRRINLAQPSVMNHLKKLVDEGLILKEKKGLYPTYRANRDSFLFKFEKLGALIMKLIGVVDSIYNSIQPNCIVLFGSASKGEDIEESDIDLFIQAPRNKIKLDQFEKLLNRKINLFFEENFSKLSSELKNNILNGIVLKGYLKVY